jgi:hypothetical protein
MGEAHMAVEGKWCNYMKGEDGEVCEGKALFEQFTWPKETTTEKSYWQLRI